MRNENNEVIEQILNFANQETDARIVMLNGSRLNSNAPKSTSKQNFIVYL
jgi:hypothetical protein